LIRLIGVVFSNSAMLSVSDKYYSVNECTQEVSELMKLRVWQNTHKFIRQLAHGMTALTDRAAEDGTEWEALDDQMD